MKAPKVLKVWIVSVLMAAVSASAAGCHKAEDKPVDTTLPVASDASAAAASDAVAADSSGASSGADASAAASAAAADAAAAAAAVPDAKPFAQTNTAQTNDARFCATGDPSDERTIAACDRKDRAAEAAQGQAQADEPMSEARRCLQQQDYDCAEANLKTVLRLQPGNAEAASALAEIHRKRQAALQSDWNAH